MPDMKSRLSNPDWCYCFMNAIAKAVDETWTHIPEVTAHTIINLAQESEPAGALFGELVGYYLEDIIAKADAEMEGE